MYGGRGLAAGAAAVLLTSLISVQPVAAAGLAVAVSGNRLVDASGQTLHLRGVDRSGTEYMCVQNGAIFDGPSTDASLATIATWHANAIRVPLNEDCWLGINGEPVGGLSAASYQSAIKNYVALAHNHGFYVILELHWNAAGSGKATGQQAMVDADHGPALWSSVAAAFKTDPAVLFDLYNEPQFISWSCWRDGTGCPVSWPVAGMQSLVNAVRATGATQPIMLGGVSYSNDLSQWLSYEPNDPRHALVASFHTYNFNTCNSTSCWNNQVAPVAVKVPVVAGEIGEDDGGHGFIDSFMSFADPKGISYLAWTWDTWGCGGPVLISNYNGTPCSTFGSGYQAHLLSFGVVPTPTPTATPAPTPTPTPPPTPTPTATPKPTASPTPAPTATPTPAPSSTATPSSSPTATPTATSSPSSHPSGGSASRSTAKPSSRPSAKPSGSSGITALAPSGSPTTPAVSDAPSNSGSGQGPLPLALMLLAAAGVVIFVLKRLG